MPPAIRIENLGKRYSVNHAVERPDYRTLRESLVSVAAAPWRRIRSGGQDGAVEDFWALKDISFDVQPGEVVGIIGRNGAGKSTLLKILSRITKPTTGRVTLRGRVGSLLEVGTGFHPELTGRENVYLNGGILGMTRKEIDRNFDAIVDFSGVEKFLDTPVKRYSSGMQVRLAFAVAAHLDPEILIVDEVLAVGDAEFQKKCLGKMQEVSTSGRTVFFVSHNLGAIGELCSRCVHLSAGRVNGIGSSSQIIGRYLAEEALQGEIDLTDWTVERSGPGPMRVTHLATRACNGDIRSLFTYREPIVFNVLVQGKANSPFIMGIIVRDSRGIIVLHLNSLAHENDARLVGDRTVINVQLDDNILNDGTYYVTIWLADSYDSLNDRVGNSLSFTVNSSVSGIVRNVGLVRLPAKWTASSLTPDGAPA